MNIGIFYSSLGTVALIIALGFLLGKKHWVSEQTNKQLVDILLLVAMPCALFTAFPSEFDSATLQSFLMGITGGLLVFTVLIILSKLIFNKTLFKRNQSFEGQFAFIFNNASFLGFPLVMTVFGQQALIPYSGFIIVFNIALFSYGIYLFERKFSRKLVKQALLNPNIIAVLLGTLFFLLSWRLPNTVDSAISYVCGIMTPLSLVCIGFMLSRANFKKLVAKPALFAMASIQLIIGPLVTFLILWIFQFPADVRNILVLIQALPTATSLGLFAKKYGGDHVEASEIVALSTILSVITLPIIVGLLIS